MLHSYEFKGATVLSPEPLSDYKVPLVVAMAERIKIPSGQYVTSAFVSDLLKDTALFPEGGARPMKEMRILRTLTSSVQVNDVVLSYENAKKTRMYEKTKKVIVQRTTLAAMGIQGVTVSVSTPIGGATTLSASAEARIAKLESALDQILRLSERLAELEVWIFENGLPAPTATEAADMSALDARFAKLETYVKSRMVEIERTVNNKYIIESR